MEGSIDEEGKVLDSKSVGKEVEASVLETSQQDLSTTLGANSESYIGAGIETPFVTKRRGRLKKSFFRSSQCSKFVH